MSVYTLFIMLYLKHTNGTLWITSYKIPSYERGLRAATKKGEWPFFQFFVIAFILASLNLHNVGKLKWILKVANFLNLYFLLATFFYMYWTEFIVWNQVVPWRRDSRAVLSRGS